jgi:Zn-dependent proteases
MPMEISIVSILLLVVIIVISMTLHEISHAYVAFWLGDYTPKAQGRLSFNPIKHLDPVMSLLLPLMLALAGGPIFGGAKPVQINTNKLKWNEWGFALVALAGPLMNLLIAFISFSVLYYLGSSMSELWGSILLIAVQVNLGFLVFNMIPIPPLDGSRIIYAIAPEFVQSAMSKIENYGIMAVMVLVIVFSSALSTIMSNSMLFILEIFNKLMI